MQQLLLLPSDQSWGWAPQLLRFFYPLGPKYRLRLKFFKNEVMKFVLNSGISGCHVALIACLSSPFQAVTFKKHGAPTLRQELHFSDCLPTTAKYERESTPPTTPFQVESRHDLSRKDTQLGSYEQSPKIRSTNSKARHASFS